MLNSVFLKLLKANVLKGRITRLTSSPTRCNSILVFMPNVIDPQLLEHLIDLLLLARFHH